MNKTPTIFFKDLVVIRYSVTGWKMFINILIDINSATLFLSAQMPRKIICIIIADDNT